MKKGLTCVPQIKYCLKYSFAFYSISIVFQYILYKMYGIYSELIHFVVEDCNQTKNSITILLYLNVNQKTIIILLLISIEKQSCNMLILLSIDPFFLNFMFYLYLICHQLVRMSQISKKKTLHCQYRAVVLFSLRCWCGISLLKT